LRVPRLHFCCYAFQGKVREIIADFRKSAMVFWLDAGGQSVYRDIQRESGMRYKPPPRFRAFWSRSDVLAGKS